MFYNFGEIKSMYSDQFLTTAQNILKFLKRSGWILLLFSVIGIGYGAFQASHELKLYETTLVGQTNESSAAVAVSLLNILNGKEGKLIQLDEILNIDIEAKSQMTNLVNDSINIGGIEIQFRYTDTVDLLKVVSQLELFVNTDEVMQNQGDLIISQNFSTPISIENGWFKSILKNLLKFLMIGLSIALILDLRKALRAHSI
jgi:hypothetical protein